MPYRLKSLKGFPYRFGRYTGITPFLKHYVGSHIPRDSLAYHRTNITLRLVREDVLKYRDTGKCEVDERKFKLAAQQVSRRWHLPVPVKMIHYNDLLQQDLDIWTASPGLPYTLMGYKKKNEIRKDPHLANNIRWMWHNVKTGKNQSFPDCCAFVRSHLAPVGEEKARAVWGYPIAMTLGEGIFALPLIRAYQKVPILNRPIAFGYETACGGTRRLLQRFSKLTGLLGLDYKSFDKTVPEFIIRAAFAILEENIDFLHYEDRGTANVTGVLRQWDKIIDYFINTIIRLPNGERYVKRQGIASGSYFTQLVGSLCNDLIIHYISLLVTGKWPEDCLVFGDDSIFSRPGLTIQGFQKELQKLDMNINVMKSGMSDNIGDLDFLGYSINYGEPSKHFSKWVCSLLYPEYPDTSWDETCSRALGLLYANLGVDQRFHNICRDILQTSQGCDLVLSRDMQRVLRLAGVDVGNIGFRNIPTPLELHFKHLVLV